MTLEKCGPVRFNFWLKKSKKKIQVAKMTYEAKSDAFTEAGEAATLAMPNKIIYLERDQLQKLTPLTPLREGLDLKGLLVLIFKHFSFQSANFSLHYLRAYHLIDVLRRTTQEDVEFTLLNSPEFEKSDKKKGIFYYHETPSELPVEEREAEAAAPAGEGVVEVEGEMTSDEFLEHEFTILEQPAPPKPAAPALRPEEAAAIAEAEAELEAFEEEKKPKAEKEAAAAPKKEREKKKLSIESDRRPKTRKSERRVKEEEIELLESEREALFAEKAAEDEGMEGGAATEAAGEAAEAAKPAGPGPLGAFGGGMFAEKLKVALKKKREEPAEDPNAK